MQGTTPVMTSLPDLVCAEATAQQAAKTVATARITAALDAIAVAYWVGDGVE